MSRKTLELHCFIKSLSAQDCFTQLRQLADSMEEAFARGQTGLSSGCDRLQNRREWRMHGWEKSDFEEICKNINKKVTSESERTGTRST